MTSKEVAALPELKGVSIRTIQLAAKSGELQATKQGRDWNISRAAAIQWNETRQKGPGRKKKKQVEGQG